MELAQLRERWNEVLDHLERTDRVAWIAFFDARLADLEGGILTLDFSDARKFGGAHEYSPIREKHLTLLREAILTVTGESITVREQ